MKTILFAVVTLMFASHGNAADSDSARTLEGAQTHIYKRVGTNELRAYVFSPSGQITNRPAIVFFFGGGWAHGTPKQFEQHCRHFASRGMVSITAEYRIRTKHGVAVRECVEDAKSCVRWVRKNAARFGIDPNRIAAGGGSAGGHLAAATAIVPGFDTDLDAKSVSCAPNALVLFNPALMLAPVGELHGIEPEMKGRAERFGADPKALSPIHHVKPGVAPTIILHGKADETVSFRSVEAFAAAMKKAGNRCELVGYEGQGHGFFNVGRGKDVYYQKTLEAADSFLVSIGFLPRTE